DATAGALKTDGGSSDDAAAPTTGYGAVPDGSWGFAARSARAGRGPAGGGPPPPPVGWAAGAGRGGAPPACRGRGAGTGRGRAAGGPVPSRRRARRQGGGRARGCRRGGPAARASTRRGASLGVLAGLTSCSAAARPASPQPLVVAPPATGPAAGDSTGCRAG